MTLEAGAEMYMDRVVKVRVVREIDGGRTIVAVGSDTTIVNTADLTESEF